MGLDRGLNSSSTNPLGIDDDDYTATTRGAQGPKGDDGASTQDYIDKYNTVVSSAAAASVNETNSATSATSSANSATASNNSATASASSATDSAASATTASTKASEASTSATNSANSATASANSATESANSATASANSATASANSASTATTQASLATTNGQAQVTLATTQAGTATTKASEASTSATNAATSATNSANSATASANSATGAASSASTATTKASESATSATNAANSAAAAAASFDSFDDRYLGAKASEPSTNNDGDALVAGNLYFLTGTGMQVYDGANWIAASSSGNVSLYSYEYIATAGQTSFSGADVNGQTLSYTANNIHVTYGGLDIPKADYVATNGTTVVLDDGAVVGTIVRIVAFQSFVVANTYTKSQADTLLAAKATIASPSFTGNVSHGDNVKAKFGAGDDGFVYSDGTNILVEGQNADSEVRLLSDDRVVIGSKAWGESFAIFNDDGAVSLYYDGGVKIATTATGVAVTGGIAIGGTGAANTLSDYETGTWTPAYTGSSTSGQTYSAQEGSYTKIGRVVHIQAWVKVTNKGTIGGPIRISGFPFTVHPSNQSSVSIGYTNGYNLTAGNNLQLWAYSDNFVYLFQAGGTNNSAHITTGDLDTEVWTAIGGTYHTNA